MKFSPDKGKLLAAAVLSFSLLPSQTNADPAIVAAAAVDLSESIETTEDWVFKTALGYDSCSGNTEKDAASAHFEAVKANGKFRLFSTFDGAWEETQTEKDGVKTTDTTVNNIKAAANFKTLFNGYFLYVDVSGLHDEISDIRYRFIESVGIGTFLFDTDALRFSIQGGVAYVQEDIGETDQYASLRFAERIDWKPVFANGVSFWESVETLVNVEGFDRHLVTAEAGMDVPLFANLSLQLKATCNYDSDPAKDKKSTDRRLMTQVAYRF